MQNRCRHYHGMDRATMQGEWSQQPDRTDGTTVTAGWTEPRPHRIIRATTMQDGHTNGDTATKWINRDSTMEWMDPPPGGGWMETPPWDG